MRAEESERCFQKQIKTCPGGYFTKTLEIPCLDFKLKKLKIKGRFLSALPKINAREEEVSKFMVH